MVVYEIYSSWNRLEYAPSRKGAETIKRELVEAGHPADGIKIRKLTFPATRAGLVSALYRPLALTAFNEG